ncbi:hypothetical protein SAMN03097699_0525 [Flavobacteriaceae bacterium MAR_2010_188]|nr:hypothetical protein SAMN03097699_0525 [Flavobacteriaceae bacterium MAR_2010_188]
MKSKQHLNQDIFLTTNKIQEEYPELLKYIDEIPVHFLTFSDEGLSRKELRDYLESLDDLLRTYAKVHL